MKYANIVIGIGSAGCDVIGKLEKQAETISEFSEMFRLVSVDEGSDIACSELRRHVGLSGSAARKILQEAASSDTRYSWLGGAESAWVADEVSQETAAGQRWVGRCAILDGILPIAIAIRSAASEVLRSSRSPVLRVFVVSSSSGGTGSGGFADISLLVQKLVSPQRLIGVLILPGSVEVAARKNRAGNTFACLWEAFFLKYKRIPFAPPWADDLGIWSEIQEKELWQRLFLFKPPPLDFDFGFEAVVGEIGNWILAQSLSSISREIDRQTAGDIRLVVGDRLDPERLQSVFSCGGAIRVSIIKEEVRENLPGLMAPGGAAGGEAETRAQGVDFALAGEVKASEREVTQVAALLEPLVSEARTMISRDLQEWLRASASRCQGEGKKALSETHREVSTVEANLIVTSVAGEVRPGAPWWAGVDSVDGLQGPVHLKLTSSWWPQAVLESTSLEDFINRSVLQLNAVGLGGQQGARALSAWLKTSSVRDEVLGFGLAQLRGWWRALWHAAELFKEIATPTGLRVAAPKLPGFAASLRRFWLGIPGPVRRLARLRNIQYRAAMLEEILKSELFKQAFDEHFWGRLLASLESADPTSLDIGGVQVAGDRVEKKQCMSDPFSGHPAWELDLRARLEVGRSAVFGWDLASPQARRYSVAAVPTSWLAEEEHASSRARIEQLVHSALGCSCRLVPSPDGQLWLFYEGLFHSPCEISDVAVWKRAYEMGTNRAQLHVDARWALLVKEDDLCAKHSIVTVVCGNPDCNHNIGPLPRELRICPGCHLPIRSRCGNSECRADDLHKGAEATSLNCPKCGSFNHAAWWRCLKHGKREVAVSIDKATCVECLERHHRDASAYPTSCISHNPYLASRRICPNCERLAESRPDHIPWPIPTQLIRFIDNGVNGHDLLPFQKLADLHQMPERARCPMCRTLLVPVHHKKLSLEKGAAIEPIS